MKYDLLLKSHTDVADYEDAIEAISLGEAAHKLYTRLPSELKEWLSEGELENHITWDVSTRGE